MFERIRNSALARKGGAVAVIALAMAGLAAGPGASASEAGNKVVASAEGAVTTDGKAAVSPVAAVGQGPVIETSADGNVVLKRPGDSNMDLPNSKISAREIAGDREHGFLRTLGKLPLRLESRKSRDFRIKTPYLAAAIKGTTFAVEVDDTRLIVI